MTKPAATATIQPAQDIAALSFEAAMRELEVIVKSLESGNADLDKAIGDYQRGSALKTHCLNKLAEARLKVEQIQVSADGSLKTTPFKTE